MVKDSFHNMFIHNYQSNNEFDFLTSFVSLCKDEIHLPWVGLDSRSWLFSIIDEDKPNEIGIILLVFL